MKKLILFIEVCLVCGLLIVAFSMIGNKLSKPNGIFIGAIVGGLAGIFIATGIAIYFSLANKNSFKSIIFYSILGFILAIKICFYNFNNPIIVVASTSLIGFGALLGDFLKRKSESQVKKN
jgi:fructose-specific phosphotransferase system IIC component